MQDQAGPGIHEVFRGKEDHPFDPRAASPVSFLEDVELKCILEPACLDFFIFSQCPHPCLDCVRHRYEKMAERIGEKTYGTVEWKQLKVVDPIVLVQMIEEVRDRESLASR